MEEPIQTDGGEAGGMPAAPAGASKKQQRIADLVRQQLHDQLKEELEQALEARLKQLASQQSAVPSPAPDASRASRVIPPSGAGAPAPDLRSEYERRLRSLRPGDLGAVLELKREFRKKGLEVY